MSAIPGCTKRYAYRERPGPRTGFNAPSTIHAFWRI